MEIMSDLKIIKNNGYSIKRFEISNLKSVFGGIRNHVIGLINSDGKILCYEGEPYFPIGRKHSFARLIESGDINASCFSFENV